MWTPKSMRGAGGILTAMLVLAGCTRREARTERSFWDRLGPRFANQDKIVNPDTVEFHYTLLACDLGGKELNQEIWANANEQVIDPEWSRRLKENGLRIGKLGSRMSADAQRIVQQCNPPGQGHRIRMRGGGLAKLELTDNLPRWSIFILQEGQPRGDEIVDGQGYFFVQPTLVGENTVRCRWTPTIEHGPKSSRRVPAADLAGWQLRHERDQRSLGELAFDLELESGEFLIIGCDPQRRGTIGSQYFISKGAAGQLKQTLLMLRVIRPNRDDLLSVGQESNSFFLSNRSTASVPKRSTVRETLASEPIASPKGKSGRTSPFRFLSN